MGKGKFEGCMAEGEEGRAETADGETKGGCSVSRIPILILRLHPGKCNYSMDWQRGGCTLNRKSHTNMQCRRYPSLKHASCHGLLLHETFMLPFHT